MSESSRPPGKTTISPDVLVTIVRLTALGVPGVNGLAKIPVGVNLIFKNRAEDGVCITVDEKTVSADLYLNFDRDVNVRNVSREIQKRVTRAISEMVDMQVKEINIHVEDINYETEPALS
ncbi:MAG: Asp23/Gls24 family envelope stress response protein [Anaerolineaceae bacterium]|nr:Asp23/Gls24 family envelope stress response protein [Anaerolineaceae bacterium]